MDLIELKARISDDGHLVMNCPCGASHTLVVRIRGGADVDGVKYESIGELPRLSVVPMVRRDCWRGVIADGRALAARPMRRSGVPWDYSIK